MNPSSVRAFANRGAATIADLWGEDITLQGNTFRATVNDPALRAQLVEGGLIQDGDLIVSILKTLIPAAPAQDTRLTARGRTYVVRSIQGEKDISPAWRLICEPAN